MDSLRASRRIREVDMEMFITSFAQVPDPRAGNARTHCTGNSTSSSPKMPRAIERITARKTSLSSGAWFSTSLAPTKQKARSPASSDAPPGTKTTSSTCWPKRDSLWIWRISRAFAELDRDGTVTTVARHFTTEEAPTRMKVRNREVVPATPRKHAGAKAYCGEVSNPSRLGPLAERVGYSSTMT